MPAPVLTFLDAGGKTAELIRHFPWADTTLGPIDAWPGELKALVAFVLRSPVPIVTLWHDDGYMIYNDAYSVFAGGRHPQLLGSKVREGWAEIAAFNDHVMRVVMAGSILSYTDQELTLHRNGQPEQVWMNLDYSPAVFEDGRIAGVMAIVVETTAKVRAERRVQGERERLGAMFEQAPGFMALLTGSEHRFDLVNAAFKDLIGQREWRGRAARDVLPELNNQGYFGMLDEAYASGHAVTGSAIPFQLGAGQGGEPASVRYLDFVHQPLKDEHGAVFGVFVEGSDVTERILAESALRESEAKFRTFAQAMPHHVWAAPADGALDWFNDRVYDYAGVAAGALDGDGWAAVVHPDDMATVQARWRASIAGGAPYEVEVRLRRHDGAWRWHLSRAVPMLDAAGRVLRWIGSNTDIEEQKSTAQALATLNATLEEQVAVRTAERDRIWRLSKDIMVVADYGAHLTAVNPAFTSTLGWREGDVVGTSLLDLVHPDDVQATLDQVGALSSGGHVYRFENRYRRRDGSYCTLAWTAVPDAGFIHGIGRDITADLAHAETMRRTEAALQQAQKMETIGKLTGGVAHDFNNLLQVISGNLQLLAPDVSAMPASRKRVENALASVQRGARLAASLLAFARKQPLEPKVVKVSRLITGMEDMLRRSLGEEIEIETVMSGGLWSASIDVVQVENAILNLAINARDAMADSVNGAGKLTVEVGNAVLDAAYCAAHPDVAPGQYVMIAVSDTGSGMTPEVLRHAFDPFFSTKAEGKGTGLGLSMVYGLVRQSGGHVKIYSEAGEGTTVKLYLPRSREADDDYVALDAQPVVGGSETVLVVEDDDAVRSTVVDMLTGLGYRVLKAPDATAALTVIDSGVPIDLLFTDVVMPGPLRSPDLARKAKERLPDLAVLFTSGYTENAIVHGGRLDRGVELIGKPYTKENLARKIRHVLAGEQQRRVPGPPAMPAQSSVAAPATVAAPVLRVLLVEDEDAIRENTHDLLAYLGHDVIAVASAEAAMAQLSHDVHVLLTDLQLPGIQGNDLAQVARARFPHIKVLLASGYGAALTVAGAATLPKPYTLENLRAALAAIAMPVA
jgi:PAS domain S-box-containing protein